MSLILRNDKGSPLTYTEMDDNLTYLESIANDPIGGDNIYNTDGILEGDRIVETEGNSLSIQKEMIGDGIYANTQLGETGIEYTSGGTVFPPGPVLETFTNITQKSTSGSGYGAIFVISSPNEFPSTPWRIYPFSGTDPSNFENAPGTGYQIGDTVTFSGADIYGVDGADDLIATITQLTPNSTDKIYISNEAVGLYKNYVNIPSIKSVTSFEGLSKEGSVLNVYNYVSQKSTSGLGTGLVLNIIEETFGFKKEIIDGGTGYEVGDTITISGADIGGTDGVDDISFDVLTISSDIESGKFIKINDDEILSSNGDNTISVSGDSTNIRKLSTSNVGGGEVISDSNIIVGKTSNKGSAGVKISSFSDYSDVGGPLALSEIDVSAGTIETKTLQNIQNITNGLSTFTDGDNDITVDNVDVDIMNVGIYEGVSNIDVIILGSNEDGSKVYSSKINGTYKYDGSTITKIGTDDKTEKSEFTSVSSQLIISSELRVQVTGELGETINWNCNVTVTSLAIADGGGGGK